MHLPKKKTPASSELKPAVTPQSLSVLPTRLQQRWVRWVTLSRHLTLHGFTAVPPALISFFPQQPRLSPAQLSQRMITSLLTQHGAQLPSSTSFTNGARRASAESTLLLLQAHQTMRVAVLLIPQTTPTGLQLSNPIAGPTATHQATQFTSTTRDHPTLQAKT